MKYKVVEKRLITVEYEIEAQSEYEAGILDGDILSEIETDNQAYELVKCELIEE